MVCLAVTRHKATFEMKLEDGPKIVNAYHHGKKVRRDQSTTGRPERAATYRLSDKPFIAWDGEGINLAGIGRPQSYVLFGSTVGHVSNPRGLSTFECLEHIVDTGARNPGAVHIGFAFSYDANMVCQSLSPTTLDRLHRLGWVKLKRSDGTAFVITFARGKFFRVTKQHPGYDRKKNPHAKTTVQIFDIFSFFACSFVKAYEDMIGPVPDVIKSGKQGRPNFSIEEFDVMEKYWSIEVQLMRELAEELRKRVYNAGLRISQWHGPGALASYAMGQRRVKAHMADTSPEIRLAARYAYAGGRFELYKCGRIEGPVYGYDINSAYPYAISQLPSLTDGTWRHVTHPERVSRFGVYRVALKRESLFESTPSPLFHRDEHHNISFPWHVEGWYWSPEAGLAARYGGEIIEGWEYRGSKARPFDWIPDMYATRRDWKARGISAQLALKLCMNSMYGKLAQRLGWTEATQRIPPFHQLEWAGWVTSYTRTMLYMLMARIPFDKLIAVETDGIFTTIPPDELGVSASSELGGWEISEYSEVLYVQSGLAWMRNTDGDWKDKRRGLDPCRKGHKPRECDCEGTFSLGACERYLQGLHPRPTGDDPWNPYVGQTSRFVGMGQALASSIPMGMRHCVWETVPREIAAGTAGKRVHAWRYCGACDHKLSAYDQAHDLVIRSTSALNPMSYPHSIPWEKEEGHADWRDYQESQDGYVTSQYV